MKSPPFLPLGTVIHDRDTNDSFEIRAVIGQGGFAQCFSVIKTSTEEEFAAKIIKKSELTRPKNRQKLLSEIKIHLSVNHKHIVKLYTYFEDKNFVFLIMEICHNKSMMDLLKKNKVIEERYVRVFLLQIVYALDYLHNSCSVVHRDMKLANLFLDRSFNIKVGDFGLAAVIEKEERKKTICGTPNYIAPEVLFNSEDGHSFEVDVWSVGVILYTMIVGRPPFQKSDVKEIYKSIKTNSYTYPEECGITEKAKKLIGGLLELDPKKRLTLEEICNSEFVKEGRPELPPLYSSQESGFSAQRAAAEREKRAEHRWREREAPQKEPGTERLPFSETEQNRYEKGNAEDADKKENVKGGSSGLLSLVDACIVERLGVNTRDVPADPACHCDYVIETLDQTERYGLGYLLASGALGVLFNDNTSVVLRKTAVEAVLKKETDYHFEYLEQRIYGEQRIITKEKYFADSAPKKFEKKIALSQQFAKALCSAHRTVQGTSEKGVFVIKHVSFAQGTVLRLSNRTIVFIVDGQVLVFTEEGKSLFVEGRKTVKRELLVSCHEMLLFLLKR